MTADFRFDNQTVIITGAGGGIGRVYAIEFAKRGANVVVNDLNRSAAESVVQEIVAAGGKAAANFDSVENGEGIVKTAVDNFGGVHVLINNAGILRDKPLLKMTDAEWDIIHAVHLRGAYKTTRACWDLFLKQKYGRVVNTTSAAGIYGNYSQTNYASAKAGLIGMGMSLAREGERKNILCNIIAPIAASKMTETVLPKEVLEHLNPEFVAPLVLKLCHESNTENGSLFEVGAGFVAKLRRERSKGAIFKTDDSFTPSAIDAQWQKIDNFANAEHPDSIMEVDWMGILEHAKSMSTNQQGSKDFSYKGKVAIVTGAGAGLGKAYATYLSKLGCALVVNDFSKENADGVVAELKAAGNKNVVANYDSVENGDRIVEQAVKEFGQLNLLVNNAGILRDKSFGKMTDAMWDAVYAVHLRGTYKTTKAAFAQMAKQKTGGRLIATSSAVGLYGNVGQVNYASAKSAVIGFFNALAIEGAKFKIGCNLIAPNAGTAMTRTVMPEEMVQALSPNYVAPLIAYIGHENCQSTGAVFEVGSGWISRVRWQRTGGVGFPVNQTLTPEVIDGIWGKIIDFQDGRATNPSNLQESIQAIFANFTNEAGSGDTGSGKELNIPKQEFVYSERDSILYNLGVGATRKDLNLVYENNDNFTVLPSFGVIPAFPMMMQFPMQDIIGDFNPMMLLHGEQYLEIIKPIPSSGKLVNEAKVVDVLDKGKGCVLIIGVTSRDTDGNEVCYNEYSNFIRGVKGVGTKQAKDRGAATALNSPPNRDPDAVVKEKTNENQAALYRLSGDYNPLHIDPAMAQMGGFDVPILHGLCSFGIAAKHVFKTFANNDPAQIKSIKVRFAKHVFPGETLQTEMWKSDDCTKIFFQVRVLERNVLAITNAAVELRSASNGAVTKDKANGKVAPVDGFKASQFFTQLQATFDSKPVAARKQQVKKTNAVFTFDLKSGGKSASWFIDLKNGEGSVGNGAASKADCTIIMSDSDFVDLASGKINGQKAFMSGKLKIKGNVMLSQKLDALLKEGTNGAKL